ncbi:MAG: DNA methylase [Syntrophobacterales bacterium CG23_combo_of_CG06-09_8_20_14_all_48_27]|nr:MAG: DNA methylase [Syntrophobacterales bacterium CG23_combo_of_CG06-09_8_20_14_all_48_27]
MSFAKPSDTIQMSLFPQSISDTKVADLVTPKTYTGLAGFHKYWGKKPIESLCYLIEKCTKEGDIVMDPFLGSGLISLECLLRNRRFVGIDINPFSVEHASLLLNLPSRQEYYQALIEIENSVARKINDTYRTSDDKIASHYLWEGNKLISVWVKPKTGRSRIEFEPSNIDLNSYSEYEDYNPKYFRNLRFFTNSRINVKPTMTVSDIFTGRAMHNIDLLIESLSDYPAHLKRALFLTLTSSAGQMSNMVFAIKNRSKGKRNGNGNKIEVGSWVIGFWLPDTHFEINVWNCFNNRANKLLKALPVKRTDVYTVTSDPETVDALDCNAWLVNSDCRSALKKMPSQSVSFVCTDPPHSDRVPYLELSELWNSLLGYTVDFEREIVVSNAKERQKSIINYNSEMTEFFMEISRVLKPNGYIALYFNARDDESWQYLKSIEKTSGALKFLGCFPMTYSATSVVQDNRKGAMKSDFIIIYKKGQSNHESLVESAFLNLPGWSVQFPAKKEIKKK